VAFQEEPCPAGDAVAAVLGDADPASPEAELWIACAGDTLELHALQAGPPPTFQRVATASLPGSPRGLAADPGSPSRLLVTFDAPSASGPSPGTAALYELQGSVIAEVASTSFLADVAMRLDGAVPLPDFATVALADPLRDDGACALAVHGAGGDLSYDLHLAGSTNACLDRGGDLGTAEDVTALAATIDVDGDLRTPGAPDVGADEVP
jgi:hypothetical protein